MKVFVLILMLSVCPLVGCMPTTGYVPSGDPITAVITAVDSCTGDPVKFTLQVKGEFGTPPFRATCPHTDKCEITGVSQRNYSGRIESPGYKPQSAENVFLRYSISATIPMEPEKGCPAPTQ